MTSGEKLFFFILTFSFLLAKTVPLEFALVPIINCYDLNRNKSSDFVAMSNSDVPRTLYHIELSSTNAEILWEYTMPEDKKGYFVDVILEDFDNNGTIELIAAAYQDEKKDIFYIFSANATGFHDAPPIVTGLQNISFTMNNPRRLYPLETDTNQPSMFLLSQGSPNRKIIMCEFLDDKIIARGSVGEKFLNNTMAPIDIALGDFNGDGIEDIFILDNGFNPAGYFIYSDGNEEELGLPDYPRLQFLNEKGVDINFDGTDDLVIINRSGELMSNIWDTKSISLSEEKIQNIIIKLDNGIIYLTGISQTGKIRNYSIDPLTRSILSTNFELPAFTVADYSRAYSLATSHEIFISHNGDHPEIWSIPLTMELITDAPLPIRPQRIYYQEPDYVINVGEDFSHHIEGNANASFRNFTEENIPSGMDFDLEEVKLVWTPTQSQLGYHKLSYTLELMEKGNLERGTDEGKKFVSQNEYIVKKNYSYLIYVNDFVTFKNVNENITIVNGELFKEIIQIDDKNGDAQLSVEIISGNNDAEFHLFPPVVISDSLDTMSEPDGTVAKESVYVDSVQTDINKITVDDSSEKQLPDFLQIAEEIVETEVVKETIVDTLIKPEEMEKEVLVDTNYLEISYTELIIHQAQFSWEPQTEPGDYNFTVKVTDGFTADTMALTLTVHPGIDLSMNTTRFTATVGEFFNTDIINIQVPPSDNYEYLHNNAPENMRIDTTGSINWVPLPTQIDNYNFEIEVTDGIASTLLKYNIYVNAPPVISSRPPTIFILPKGGKLNFAMKSFDLNSNTKLDWKLLSGPTEMTLSQQGDLQWSGNELGHHPYEIQLSDGIDSVQWKASIYVNTPPVITSIPIKAIPTGEQYFYPLFARDENTISPFDSLAVNEIIYSLVQGPEGMNIDENNTLIWETRDNPPGEYMIAITASDGADDAIQVFPVFINSFPVITSSDSLTVSVGDTLKFQIKAYDPNPMDTLTFHLDTLHKDLVMELHSGLLIWTPKKSDIGLNTFNLQVKDGHDDTGTKMQLHIYVFVLPQLTSELLSEAFADIEYTVFLTSENMYGNKLSGTESIIIDTATFNDYNFSEYTHLFKWTPGEKDKGDHEIVIKLTDDFGFTTYHTHKLSVFANPCVHCDKEDKSTPADTTGN